MSSSGTSGTASPRCWTRRASLPERLLGVGIGVPGIVARTPDAGAVVHGQTIRSGTPSRWSPCSARPANSPTPSRTSRTTAPGPWARPRCGFGAGRGARNAVVVLFGSGVGACLVTEDVEHGRWVEWGHLTVRVRGRRCRCGALGCLEAYAGAEALLDRCAEGGRPPEGADEETALTAMLTAAYPAEEGGESRPRRARRPGGDRRVPGRGPVRPDQPLPGRRS